mmetsp:Transcript_20092/g.31425  ORF Transcript_20092/g.31425 Transcript_20092/m.31425 type:complete len:81 (-) Transcript_20092:23-265(-)
MSFHGLRQAGEQAPECFPVDEVHAYSVPGEHAVMKSDCEAGSETGEANMLDHFDLVDSCTVTKLHSDQPGDVESVRGAAV